MEIRRMISADVAEVAKIEAECFPDPYSERSISDVLCTEGAMCFSAIDNSRVVAYFIGRLIAPEGELYRIATDVRYRQRGIAYRLLDYSVKTAKGDGLEALFLEVRKSNMPAISLYTQYGFKTISYRKNYYKNPTEDAVIMMYGKVTDDNFSI